MSMGIQKSQSRTEVLHAFLGPITSNGREATVTDRAARFNSDPASCDTEGDRCEPKGLIHPWWTESS